MIVWDDLFQYVVFWGLFGLLHSLFATEKIKKIIPLKGRAFRLFYNFIAVVSFLIVLTQVPSITLILVKVRDLGFLQLAFFVFIFGIGLLVTAIGLLNWNIPGFLGFTNEDDLLNVSGIYSISRHPFYSGIILILLSTLIIEISTATLSWIIGAGGYFIIGSIPEENKLKTFHEVYNEYRINVGRFFPSKPRHMKYIIKNIKS